jgi:hypothetical protein
MINKVNGNINLGLLGIIPPNCGLDDLNRLRQAYASIERNMNNGWIWHYFKKVTLGNLYFSFSFAFNNNKLEFVTIVLSKISTDLETNRDSWSMENEYKKLVFYNDWLNSILGQDRNFDWGEVGAAYDNKGGFSSIGIRYK